MLKLLCTTPLLILMLACSSAPEYTAPAQAESSATATTELRVMSRARQPVPARCLMQSGENLTEITAPAKLNLPVLENTPGGDILLTCEYDGQRRSAILKSRIATAQKNLLVDTSTGESLLVSEINDDAATSGINNVSDVLALGLSTNVIAGNYYVYPSLVNIQF